MKIIVKFRYSVLKDGEILRTGFATDETIAEHISWATLEYGKRIQFRVTPV
jgi:hypothetical protein